MLDSSQRERAISHIAECAQCREVASALMHAAPGAPASNRIPVVERDREAIDPRGATQAFGRSCEVGMTLLQLGTAAPAVLSPPGYLLGETIGRGGMGAVIAAQDLRIGREVAVKRMTAMTPDGDQVARFLREARIQARLEHPAIVPVHELSVDEHGRPFFTMKRISGQTLSQRLVEGAPQNRLLSVF